MYLASVAFWRLDSRGASEAIDDARANRPAFANSPASTWCSTPTCRADPEIDRLPAIFDQAVPQWAAYFGVDAGKDRQLASPRLSHRRPPPVRRAWPDAARARPVRQRHLDRLANCGSTISRPPTIAVTCCCTRERTSSWPSFLGGCGPGWYMEGTAELFGTHRLDEQYGPAHAAHHAARAAKKCRCSAASN